jgi:hypothetical protein
MRGDSRLHSNLHPPARTARQDDHRSAAGIRKSSLSGAAMTGFRLRFVRVTFPTRAANGVTSRES